MAKSNGNGNGKQIPNTRGLRPAWGPGQSGNKRGRPKGTGLTDRLRKILDKDAGKVAQALMEAGVKAACKGDFRFWQEILNRIDGKVPEHQILYDGHALIKEVKIDLDRM